jgi:hypothetical protein
MKEVRKLKSLEQVENEGVVVKRYGSKSRGSYSLTFSDGSHINTTMGVRFGTEIEVSPIAELHLSENNIYQWKSEGYSYKENWFEAGVDQVIDGLFGDLLENL